MASAAPRPRSRFRSVAVLVVAACTVAAGYGGYWWAVTERLEANTRATIEALRGQGYAVSFAELHRGGFPFRARLEMTRPALQVTGPASAWGWAAEQATIEIAPLSPGELTLRSAGRQALALQGAPGYSGEAEELSLALKAGGWLPVGRLTVRGLALNAAAGNTLAIARLEATTAGDPAAAADAGSGGYTLTATGSGLRLPDPAVLPLADEINHLAIDARIVGALAPAPWPKALGTWRDLGGVIELSRVELVHGALEAKGQGTLALDAQFQPIGAMSVQVRGFQAAIAKMQARRVINADTAATLNLVLQGLARPGSDGSSALSVPLSLQNRTLFAGPLPLARLPEIRWWSPQPAGQDPQGTPRFASRSS